MGNRPSLIAAVVVLGLILVWQLNSSLSLAEPAAPEAAAAVPIANEVLGRAIPVTVENPEPAFGRVTVMPGSVLPVHFHPGTQIGVIVEGELAYTVFTGEIEWYRAESRSDVPDTIRSGETVVVRPGDAMVESPESIHQGRNNASVPLVIYQSTLFPADAPRAVVVVSPIP